MPLRVQRGSTKRTRRAALARKEKAENARATRFISQYRGNTPPEFPNAEPKSNWEYSTPAPTRTIHRMLARHHATKSRRSDKPTHHLPSEFQSVLYSTKSNTNATKTTKKNKPPSKETFSLSRSRQQLGKWGWGYNTRLEAKLARKVTPPNPF